MTCLKVGFNVVKSATPIGETEMQFVKNAEEGKAVAAELFTETGKPQFVCDAGWGSVFVTNAPKIFTDIVRFGVDASGALDSRAASALAFE